MVLEDEKALFIEVKMWLTPPPMELTKADFEKRLAAGARTFEEIDPEFCAWLKRGERQAKFQIAVIIIGAGVMAAIGFLALFAPSR